jgi:phospholipid transport system substrate-binding protein
VNRRSILLGCAAAAAVLALEGGAAQIATESPVATIATLQAGLIAAGNGTIEERYRALEPAIVATHDLPYIAEFALRRQWASLTDEQRQRFVEAFERLSVMTYAARFGNVAADAFRALEAGEPDASGRVQVATAIKREGQADVSLEYLLHETPEGWRIINIVADGVSDLALKRAEYQRVFASGGIDGLIAELTEQAERLTRD